MTAAGAHTPAGTAGGFGRAVCLPLYHLHNMVKSLLHEGLRMFWYTPLFQQRLTRRAPGLHVFGGMPLVLGRLDLVFGADCRISGQTTLAGRAAGTETPCLTVGRNAEIGWQTTIAVGRRIEIGNNVLIAGRCFLAGYPGHPLDPASRAAGQPETEDQVGDIILEDDVWLATNVTVLAGVRIGRGTVVTPGSVVFRDLPAGVIATGAPARVVGPVTMTADLPTG